MKHKLNDLNNVLSRIKYIAINGVRDHKIFERTIQLFLNQSDWKFINGKECISVEDMFGIDSVTKLCINLVENNDEEIASLFSEVRDLQAEYGENQILFYGDWTHNIVKDIIKNHYGTSYPFTLENSELYINSFRYFKEDFDIIRRLRSFDKVESWKILLDYTNGEYFTTTFLLDKLNDFDSFKIFDEYFLEKCFDLYQNYIRKDFFKSIRNLLSEGSMINSFYCRSIESEDIIKRSNIFEKIGKKGRYGIFYPINFFSKYIISMICDQSKNNYEPSRPTIFRSREILLNVMEIERMVKHLFFNIDKDIFGGKLLSQLPLYSSISYTNDITSIKKEGREDLTNNIRLLKLKTCESISEEQKLADTIIWTGEHNPSDYISVLTFGELIRLIKILKKTYIIDRDIVINIPNGIKSLNKNNNIFEEEQSNITSLELNKCDILSICEGEKTNSNIIFRYMPNNNYKHYSVENKIDKSKLEKMIATHSNIFKYIDIANNQQIFWVKIIEEFIRTLEKIKDYRNAISHMKLLSHDALVKFNNLKNQLYFLIAYKG